MWFDDQETESLPTADFWELCQARDDYKEKYARYWRSMGGQTKSGRAVDAVVLPVAPTTAVRDCEFHYFGYSAVANALDYCAAAFPVILGDARVDLKPRKCRPLSELDEKVQGCCECHVILLACDCRLIHCCSSKRRHPRDACWVAGHLPAPSRGESFGSGTRDQRRAAEIHRIVLEHIHDRLRLSVHCRRFKHLNS